jgi:hypothetical protein
MYLPLLLVALLLTGCSSGGGSPTSPSPSTPSSFTLSGEVRPTAGSGAGATVHYAGQQTQTDAAGRFTFTHQASTTQSVTVTHPGWLERQVWISGGARDGLLIAPIALAAPFDLTFYRQMVRNALDGQGTEPLRRWTVAPKFYIRTVDDFGQSVDGATVQAVRAGIVAGVTQLSPFGSPVIEDGPNDRQPATGWVRVLLLQWTQGPLDQGTCGDATVGGDVGVVRLWLDRCRCPGASRVSQNLVLHETAHALGFWHVQGRHVLSPNVECGTQDQNTSAAERFHAALAYSRPRGNLDPDRDPSSVLSATAEGGAAPVVSCGG